MVSGWIGGQQAKILSKQYLRTHEVLEVHTWQAHWLIVCWICRLDAGLQCHGMTLI